MFQTNSEFLSVIGEFAFTGFFLGILYDIIRCFRTAFMTGKVFAFITDFIVMLVSGFVLFYSSIDTPTGDLRLIYVLAAVFGMAIYLITIGKITVYPARLAGKLIAFIKKGIKRFIIKPACNFFVFLKQKLTAHFGELRQKMKKKQENSHFGLKKTPPLLYNNDNNKMSKLCQIGGEERNVIKAKIRKKA